jgi:hypothetical protein
MHLAHGTSYELILTFKASEVYSSCTGWRAIYGDSRALPCPFFMRVRRLWQTARADRQAELG